MSDMNTTIAQLKDHEGKEVSLNGWVYNSRCSGKIGFLMFRDGFSTILCIISVNDAGEDKFNEFKTYTQDSSVKVIGKVVQNDKAPGGHEIIIENIDYVQIKCENITIIFKLCHKYFLRLLFIILNYY